MPALISPDPPLRLPCCLNLSSRIQSSALARRSKDVRAVSYILTRKNLSSRPSHARQSRPARAFRNLFFLIFFFDFRFCIHICIWICLRSRFSDPAGVWRIVIREVRMPWGAGPTTSRWLAGLRLVFASRPRRATAKYWLPYGTTYVRRHVRSQLSCTAAV